jgi:hypothetical protein
VADAASCLNTSALTVPMLAETNEPIDPICPLEFLWKIKEGTALARESAPGCI